jgi:hypothetical protein
VSLASGAGAAVDDIFTWRADLGVGADTSGLARPRLDTALGGIATTLRTADPGATFVQAGLSASVQVATNAVMQLGIAGESRSGATLGKVNLDVIVRF